MRIPSLVCLILLTVSCETGHNYAPVTDITTNEPIPRGGLHRVQRGETLYEIAWRYGLDYRTLAQYNHIDEPYAIGVGQQISLLTPAQVKVQAAPPVLAEAISSMGTAGPSTGSGPRYNGVESPVFVTPKRWLRPAMGGIATSFSAGHKGIDISGKSGASVHAAAGGKVVYCGDGLRGYGNLIILKHDSSYLSAYAHNRMNFVKEGDWVQQGQKIAEMGNTGTESKQISLHFEIRRAGKPINPSRFFN